MKKDLYSIEGKVLKQIELPKQFNEPVRHDLIKRAVLAIHSSKRTPYGADPEAGKRSSSILSKRRRRYRGSYGKGISRSPRKVLTKRGSHNWQKIRRDISFPIPIISFLRSRRQRSLRQWKKTSTTSQIKTYVS